MSDVKDNEAVYDREIAPLVARIIAICKEHGLPFVAEFEYAPDHYCSTAIVPDEAAPKMKALGMYLARAVDESGTIGYGGTAAPRGSGDQGDRN